MKHLKVLISAVLFMFFVVLNIQKTNAQCIDFVKTNGFEKLNTELYVPEGRFDAMVLSQGDFLKVYKSFFRGRTYKIVVIADKNIPRLKFQIKTMQGKVIYDNTQNNNSEFWEYTSDRNQNLIVSVELPSSGEKMPKSGCVAVVLGKKYNTKGLN